MPSISRLLVGTLVLGTLAATTTATDSRTAVAANDATYLDERGEDRQAPDITSVVVSNDDAGWLSVQVSTPNRARLTPDMRVRVWFWVAGRQYFLLADPYKPAPIKAALYRCETGPTGVLVCAAYGTSLRFRYARGARFGFNLADFGIDPGTSRRVTIGFVVTIGSGYRLKPSGAFDFSNVHVDTAPSKHPRRYRFVALFGS